MSVRRQRDSSSASENDAAVRSVKDRECPFCHQAFTSSSLGRHLDVFIRPHNPKQPDGVHKVDEIRRMRGRITRRQPKGVRRQDESPPRSEQSRFVNAMDWRSTGVINDVDETKRIEDVLLDTPARESPSPEEQVETARAAELALRDLVDSINAAQAAPRPTLNGVDVYSMSFPGLVLTYLPPPNSLFSTTPFADSNSWDLGAPGEAQKATLLEVVDDRRVKEHIEGAYTRWTAHSMKERSELWILEVLRTWQRVKDKDNDLQTRLATAQQRIAHLESEYEYLSRCQLPREKLLAVPTTIPLPKVPDQPLNAQDLMQKWRHNVRAVTRPRKSRKVGVVIDDQPSTHSLSSDIVLHGAVFGIGGPMHRSVSPDREAQEMRTALPRMLEEARPASVT